MVEPQQEKWHEIVKKVEDVGVDGLELNFGCPHGMAERGMGSASGQVPELVEKQTYWVKEVARTPVIVKLTPNITDITVTAEAAVRGGADAVSMINTINSLAGVDLDSWNTVPHVGGKGCTWRILWACCQADCTKYGRRMCAKSFRQCTNFRHWRDFKLAGCCGIYADGCNRRTSLYSSDAPRI